MSFIRRPATLRSTAVLGLAVAAGMAGCAGHGRNTSAEMTRAQERMSQIKSATQWEMANESYMAGDLDRALQSVNNSLALNPSVSKSHVLRGKILLELGRLEEARDSLLRAEIIRPNTIEAQYFLGIISERLGQDEEALGYYQRAADLDPAEAMYAVAAAELLIDLGRLDEAKAYLDERSNVFGNNAGVQQTLGHLALLQDDPEQAEVLFRNAQLLASDEPRVYEDLIHAQMELGRFAEAEHNIRQLQEFDGYENRRDISMIRARCLIELDRMMEAREVLLKLTDSSGGDMDANAWLDLGAVSYKINDMPRLRKAGQKLTALRPDHPEGYLYTALWQRKHGDSNGALATLEKGFVRADMPYEAMLLRGVIEQELGMFAAAERSYRAASALQPDDDRAKQLLTSLLQSGDDGIADFPVDDDD